MSLTAYQNQVVTYTVEVFGAGGTPLTPTLSAATLTIGAGSPVTASVSGTALSATVPASQALGATTFLWAWTQVAGGVTSSQSISEAVTILSPPSAPSATVLPSITRLTVKQAIRDTLGEEADNPASLAPIGLDALIDRATEDVARQTNCLYRRASTNVVSGQDVYCAPQIYKIKAVLLKTPASTQYPSGQLLLLEPTTPLQLDAYYGSAVGGGDDPLNMGDGGQSLSRGWRQGQTSTQGPFAVATEGLNRLRLSPTPGWSDPLDGSGNPTSFSFTVEGYGVPDPWPGDTSAFPLPEIAFWAVVYSACVKRCVRWVGGDNMARLPLLKAELDGQMATLEAGVVRLSEATRRPVYN